jgi:aflatoxin B1 aldehyde reductase
VEEELFGCLRKFNIKFAAYSPLAGGYLSDRFFVPTESAGEKPELAKFDPKSPSAWFYTGRYYPMASAVAELQKVVKAHGLSLNEVAFRWFQWHSAMQSGDLGVIVAASKKEQLEQALAHRFVSLIILKLSRF